jgi:excisionase family DNA binding protein
VRVTLTNDKLGYSVAEVSDILGIDRSYVYELLNRGDLVGRKLGRRTIVLAAELQRYIDELPPYEAAT